MILYMEDKGGDGNDAIDGDPVSGEAEMMPSRWGWCRRSVMMIR